MTMSTVAEIIEAVKQLDEREKEELFDRLADAYPERLWDQQIEADAVAGQLDALWQEALVDIAAGRTRLLDDVIDQPKG